ncbi:MAG: NAD(P)H-dependent oxidoreductase [Coriobacteriia bacterium]|nr:NAD(P)H-dependent oxidoreductase [Coriobacteriia bacterium]
MNSLLLLNGSPRGPRSNSMRMMARVAEGWQVAGGADPLVLHLAKRADFERAVAQFASAETVLLGMPLYTDSMPGLVAEFIEALEPRVGRSDNPRMGFLVQSGFMEPLHSRGLERYLAKLTVRLGCAYAGTIVRGGGESLQMMPDEALRGLFTQLAELGGQLKSDDRFDPQTLARVAGNERFSAVTAPAMALALKLPVGQFYWTGQLKKNGAWDRRFNAPYAPAAR